MPGTLKLLPGYEDLDIALSLMLNTTLKKFKENKHYSQKTLHKKRARGIGDTKKWLGFENYCFLFGGSCAVITDGSGQASSFPKNRVVTFYATLSSKSQDAAYHKML